MDDSTRKALTLQEYMAIARRRAVPAAACFAVVGGAGVLGALAARPVYQARGRMQLAAAPNQAVLTELQHLQSPLFVTDALRNARAPRRSASPTLIATQVDSTALVDLRGEATDPVMAADVVNGAMDLYLSRRRATHAAELAESRRHDDDECRRALAALGDAERKLRAYQRAHGVLSPTEQMSASLRELSDTQTQERAAQYTLDRVTERLASARFRADREPATVTHSDFTPNAEVIEQKSVLEKLKLQRDQLLRRYQPMNPVVRDVNQRVSDLMDEIARKPAVLERRSVTPNAAHAVLTSEVSRLEGEVDAARATLRSLSERSGTLQAFVTSASRSSGAADVRHLQLNRDVEALTRQYLDFNAKLQEVRVAERGVPDVGRVIEPASVPTRPIRPNRALLIVVALLSGAMASAGLVGGLEYLDDRIRTPDEIEAFTGLPVLGYTPVADKGHPTRLRVSDGFTVLAERYRVLRTNLEFSTRDEPPATILVTSGGCGEGKTLTAANLATAMAMEGCRVVLVDGDLRNPAVHALYDVADMPGLAEYLQGGCSLDDCIRVSGEPGLWVVPAGAVPTIPTELLVGQRMDALLVELASRFDVAVIDSGAVRTGLDAALLAARSDATVLVVDADGVRRHGLRETLSALSRARSRTAGIVLNRADVRRYAGHCASAHAQAASMVQAAAALRSSRQRMAQAQQTATANERPSREEPPASPVNLVATPSRAARPQPEIRGETPEPGPTREAGATEQRRFRWVVADACERRGSTTAERVVLGPRISVEPAGTAAPRVDAGNTRGDRGMAREHWYAVYTLCRHEVAVSRYFERLEVNTFLPLRKVWSTRTDRRVMIEAPALPGYIFIRCDMTPEIRSSVKKTPGVVTIISTDGQPCRIPDDQVEALRILMASQLEVHAHSPFEAGQVVQISKGPLKGARGILTRVNDGQHRLVVRIDHIGLAVSVDIHEADVEAVAGSVAA